MSKKYTTETFIEKANEIHNNKYDYSKSEYITTETKTIIICPIHGEFLLAPIKHLKGQGCPECGKHCRNLTTEQFILKAMEIHGDIYDYSKVEYVNTNTPVTITCRKHGDFLLSPVLHLNVDKCCPICDNNYYADIFILKASEKYNSKFDYSKVNYIDRYQKVCIICPVHGEFWLTPEKHLKDTYGCRKCSDDILRNNASDFILKAREIHGDIYDYSKVNYINNRTPITIICNKHGDFSQIPYMHLNSKVACPKCREYTTEMFILKAREIHGNIYDYSKVEYKNNIDKVCICCQVHGDFYQSPKHHLNGLGCPQCKYDEWRKTTQDFINDAIKIHGNKYDYSKVEYKNLNDKVEIICYKHGSFYQSYKKHVIAKHGCPKCNESHLETDIRITLENNNIDYVYNGRKTYFPWLDGLELDFYLPDYNIAIECQGIQHFKPINFNSTLLENDRFKLFNKIVDNDIKKKKLCEDHNVKLIYYSNLDIDYPYKVYTDINDILKVIKDESNIQLNKLIINDCSCNECCIEKIGYRKLY